MQHQVKKTTTPVERDSDGGGCERCGDFPLCTLEWPNGLGLDVAERLAAVANHFRNALTGCDDIIVLI